MSHMNHHHRPLGHHTRHTDASRAMRRRPPGRHLVAGAVIAALTFGIAACGSDDDANGTDDTTQTAPDADLDDARARAEALLGTREEDLPDDVRIGRRGDEDFALTMDLVPGRLTVELDDDGTGEGFVVTSVQLETPDGTENFGD